MASNLPPLPLTALLLALATQAQAQSPPPQEIHSEDSEDSIVVVGRMVSGGGDPIYAPVMLQGDTLVRDMRPQLGQMLEKLPGVSASGFAPGASRPVLRGFDGPRVQVLLDGLGALDASSVSADHAVSLDTLTIDRIAVLHGPQVLLYASDPSGGVVNAVDKRIPRRVPETAATIDVLASYGTAADAVTAGAAADVRIAPRFVAHLDGGYSRSSDLRIGGHVLSPGLRDRVRSDAQVLLSESDAGGASSLLAQANARRRLRNSWTRQWTLGGGLAFIDDGGDIGISASHLSSEYGIPPRPEAGPSDPVSIALRQTRFDMRAGLDLDGLNLDGLFSRAEFRGAFGDYSHAELDNGVPATRFASTGIETRLDLTQARRGAWSGSSGVQFSTGRLSVTGEERLLPDSRSTHLAAFTLQRLKLGAIDIEAAGRFQRTSLRAMPAGEKRAFSQWSGVAGVAWHPVEPLSLTLNVSRGERAPSAEELFIDGNHDATQSYERGNPAFRTERSKGVEAGIRWQAQGVVLGVTAYVTDFDDFITSVPTGELIEGFPVYQFIQGKARFRGFEAEGSLPLATWGKRTLTIDGGADYTRARLAGIGPVPRIAPLRLRGGLEFGAPAFSLRGEIEWNARQRRVAANEFPTAAFSLVSASATWRPMGEDGPLTLILSGDNLLDVDGRRAASQTRDFVPVSGRDIRLTAKIAI